MIRELFNLDFGRWEIVLLSLFPAIINILIFLYATLFLPQNETTRSFSIFVFLLGIWQTSEGFVKMSETAELGLEWNRIQGIFISFVISTGISFILDYTKWKKKIPPGLFFFLIFVPAIVSSFIMMARLDNYTVVHSEQWYWIVNPVPSIFTGIVYSWTSLGGVVMLVLLLLHLRVVRANQIKRKKALLLIIGFSAPVVGGIIGEVIFPFFLEKDSLPITNSLLTVFSISTLIAIRSYNIFEYSPNYLWGRIKDSMSEGVIIVDNSENVVFANKVFCKLLGHRFDELENRNINEFLFGREELRGAKIEGGGEVQITAKNGKKIWVMISSSPYLDDKQNTIGTIILFANINLLKESEENLRVAAKKQEQVTSDLREIQAIANVGNWELSFATNKAVWCDEALKIYGLPEGESEQSFETWIKSIHPDDMARVNRDIEMSQSTLSSSSFYHRIVRPDGTVKNIHSVSKFKFDSEGKPIGLYGLCHDVTELIGLQERLKVTNHDLKTFIYRSSHDLRTPLTSLLGLIEVGNLEITDPAALEYFGYIGELTKRMDHLLLTLIQVMSVRDHEPEINWVVTGQLVDEILNSLKDTEGFESIEFQIENHLAEAVPVDRMLLHSILFNLIENAIRYHKRGISDPRITIRIAKEPKNIRLEVIDNGIGIKERDQVKLFDMFFRATTLSNGSGLGLYLVKTCVERLGGRIYLNSQEKVGAEFIIILPYN